MWFDCFFLTDREHVLFTVFGRAVHALSRIGDEIWLEPLQKGLAVRSVNTAHSAYACFLFSPLFFKHYTSNLDELEENKVVKCKVSLKSVLPLFRSVATIERSVYRCEISINVLNNRVMFQFNCKHGITKTHNLRYQECEALQAVFPTHLFFSSYLEFVEIFLSVCISTY
uniref:Cell cycle checkpoint control protein RAD9A n=1 Tax=Pygocentrus nattereri TaxID=42514 RepID=A0A3B4DFJ8_PYGNA